MKASEAIRMVTCLVDEYGKSGIQNELKAIRDGRVIPTIQANTEAAVEAIGSVDEVQAILDAIHAPAAPAQPRPRATKAEVEALVAVVLERAKALGSAFSSPDLAAQLGKPVGRVSNALHKLVKSGQLRVEGTKRAARYSVVAST